MGSGGKGCGDAATVLVEGRVARQRNTRHYVVCRDDDIAGGFDGGPTPVRCVDIGTGLGTVDRGGLRAVDTHRTIGHRAAAGDGNQQDGLVGRYPDRASLGRKFRIPGIRSHSRPGVAGCEVIRQRQADGSRSGGSQCRRCRRLLSRPRIRWPNTIRI